MKILVAQMHAQHCLELVVEQPLGVYWERCRNAVSHKDSLASNKTASCDRDQMFDLMKCTK